MLHGERRVEMKLNRALPEKKEKKAAGKTPAAGAADPGLYQKLRALRARLAREQGVPAYVVFTDAALEDMCRRRPESAAQFLEVSGVGQKKLERYGEAFLKAIRGEDTP